MKKIFWLFLSLSWMIAGAMVTVAIQAKKDQKALTAAAFTAADELTGLLGTGYVIDDLLDALERHGTGDAFATAVLRCQHIGWERGPDAARISCQHLIDSARTDHEICRAHIEMALLETRKGSPAKALEHLNGPEPKGNLRLLAKFRLAKAEALNASGNYASALTVAKLIKPTEASMSANTLYQMGLSALGRGNLEEAESHLTRAKEIREKIYRDSGGYDEYALNLARVLRALGALPGHESDLSEAETLITPLRQREPGRWELNAGF